ncbi:uncharacterized protein TrAFT101_000137 [Trichoderma asperellum]|uniref:DUF7143 domain-containing protein n=1 Tax=Trichoderma asperellum (strain ATCC 204424 / CBS 433.97 / NBRC 101777) TaxID=1042311 RepID=A0A2T3YUB5_TRIA4|nr:hypothetical protein M441DRAFT_203303 [Trichoderma asperellum CBS 433.97]PTB36170.1 hypothetical protein M441DRAFT_203303 [Trichoderma asperellum CBS 433.97]UKZ84222.1 hypothetical protein TrAFT101_000137 [Trichoderma asperellum]
MHSALLVATFLSVLDIALANPIRMEEFQLRQAQPCFIVGKVALPQETQDAANFLASDITCNAKKTTISGVPDVSSGGISFSSIDFATSGQSPLEFALEKFATTSPLAENDLAKFQNEANVYTATEVALRSIGGNLAVKAPKFFINFQIARIQTAQGNPPTDPSQTVEHLLGKVTKNASKADQKFLDQITNLSKVLS